MPDWRDIRLQELEMRLNVCVVSCVFTGVVMRGVWSLTGFVIRGVWSSTGVEMRGVWSLTGVVMRGVWSSSWELEMLLDVCNFFCVLTHCEGCWHEMCVVYIV